MASPTSACKLHFYRSLVSLRAIWRVPRLEWMGRALQKKQNVVCGYVLLITLYAYIFFHCGFISDV